MKAVGYRKPLPITDPESLLDIDLPKPEPASRDLLVQVKAVSVNPVDTKVRASASPDGEEFKVLGYDAAGVVAGRGPECRLFRDGDEVFYAGSLSRPGTNAEFHLVDERLVGTKPKTTDFAAAAALPLTSITAWELLFDRLGAVPGKPANAGTILIIGAPGGVGSMMMQLARRLTGLTIIATASTPESIKWCLDLGAHHVIDHSRPLVEQMRAIGFPQTELIASLNATKAHYQECVEVLAPQGRLGVIDDPPTLDATLLKPKCASLHWEFMFTRSLFETPDMIAQHKLLDEVSALVDASLIRTTFTQTAGNINAANLKRAHAMIEGGSMHGKLVLAGF
jgi:zinc-binding alcohol dehydrogenase family protein